MNDKRFLPPIIIGLTIILLIFWYEPTQREILSMELETRRLSEVEREISELKARRGDLSAFVLEKELQLDEARNFLPATLAQDKFVDELYRAAEVSGARIISIRTGEVTSAEELQAQVVSVNLEADYISLMNFIREIIDGERLTTLDEISVEHLGSKVLSCDLAFKIFATAP